MKNEKKVVILGAGYAGIEAAKRLNKKFKNHENLRITLIDKNPYHTLMTELHEVAGARVEPESVQISLKKIFGHTKVQVQVDKILRVDFSERKLYSEENCYEYDYLVIGAGAEPAFFGVPGVAEHGFTIWSLGDAIKIREHIKKMFEIASAEGNEDKRRELLTFVVAGAGFTGIETIGELAEWKKRLCREYDIDPREVQMIVVEAMCNILPILSENLIKKSHKYLKRLRIKVITDAPIIKVDKSSIALKDGTSIATRTLIWTCGVQGSSFTAGLGLTMGKRNRVQANAYMQSIDYENVYIVGDNAYLEEKEHPIPQIVETALQTAECAAHNIAADIEGKEKIPFKSNYHGIMVSIGSRDAVANVMGIKTSGIVAMGIKHMVNLHYLFGVAGVNRVITYIMHEFFDIKDGRSIIGNHAAARTPIAWLALLRVYLGVIWLYEGFKKVQEGWLLPGKIFIVNLPQSPYPTRTTDVISSATQVTQYWPEPILKQPPALFQWFMDTFIAPNAYFFQVSIVLIELAIGIALIIGLFTIIASAVSLFLCVNFILSAMAGTEIFWHIFVGLAMFGGAGRSLGLDYYIMPWLKHWWRRTRFARKTFLYVD